MTSDIKLRDDGDMDLIASELIYFKGDDTVPDDEAEGSWAPAAGNIVLGGNGADGDIFFYGNDGELGVAIGGGEGDIKLVPWSGSGLEPIESVAGKLHELEQRIEKLEQGGAAIDEMDAIRKEVFELKEGSVVGDGGD